MQMDINVEGLDDLVRKLEALPGLVGERVQGDGLAAAARVARDGAKATVPVRTGALRDSIRTRRVAAKIETFRGTKRVPGGAARLVAGGKGARHAVLVEYGTVRAPAQPFMEPALRDTASRQLVAAAAAMQRAFVRVVRQIAAGKATKLTRRLAAE